MAHERGDLMASRARLGVETASPLRQQLDETVQAITARTSLRPTIGVVLGSGLGGLTNALQVDTAIAYEQLPHFPHATAPGHEGKLVLGTLGKLRVAVLAGRFHFYEGYSMSQVVYPVRLARALGVDTLMITSIVGSMNPQMPPGSLMMLNDHMNLMGANPLIGPNDEALGPRFPDMSEPYDPELRALALAVAKAEGLQLHEGVYVAVAGPNLETRAEYRMLRQMGADVVGMSMVPEVITARHMGMRVLSVAVISDACIPETLKPANIDELLRMASETEPKLTRLLQGILSRL